MVSSLGRVASYKGRRGKFIGQHLCVKGYLSVSLRKDNTTYARQIQRLVLEAFQGPPSSEVHVARHLDGNPSNNELSNLAWGTERTNAADRVFLQLLKQQEESDL